MGTSAPQARQHRREALKEADLIILAGSVCDFRLSYGRTLPRKAKIIAINRNKEQLFKVLFSFVAGLVSLDFPIPDSTCWPVYWLGRIATEAFHVSSSMDRCRIRTCSGSRRWRCRPTWPALWCSCRSAPTTTAGRPTGSPRSSSGTKKKKKPTSR